MAKVIAIWKTSNHWSWNILQRDDGKLNYASKDKWSIEVIASNPEYAAEHAVGEEEWISPDLASCRWDQEFYKFIERGAAWRAQGKSVGTTATTCISEKEKLTKFFFMGRENVAGCECGAWVDGNTHSSWCRCYRSDLDPKECYSPTFDSDD